jgi:hypothetical protein
MRASRVGGGLPRHQRAKRLDLRRIGSASLDTSARNDLSSLLAAYRILSLPPSGGRCVTSPTRTAPGAFDLTNAAIASGSESTTPSRTTGKLENIWRLSETINFARDIDPKSGQLIDRIELPMGKSTLVCPSPLGARSWNSGAYNPKTGLWYTPAMEICSVITPVEQKSEPNAYGTPPLLALPRRER